MAYTTDKVSLTVTPTGGAGTSTGSGTTPQPLNGLLTAIYVEYAASSAATTDVTITAAGLPILTLTNINTTGWYAVQLPVYSAAGAALAGVYVPIPISDVITVSVAQADNNKSVTVTFFVVK